MQVDPRYRWRNDTLIQRFGITPDEERRLATIVSRGEARRRDAERKVEQRVERREAAGARTRAEYEGNAEQKRATARLLRVQGKSWSAIAVEVGYKNADAARKSCA